VRFFQQLGYAEHAVEDLSIVVADAAVQYLSEGFHGETLVIEMVADDLNKYGFDLRYRISERKTGREVARGKSGIVFIDPASRRIAPMPTAFRARLEPMSVQPG
jgi:acyl-CoA thioester hydrolase